MTTENAEMRPRLVLVLVAADCLYLSQYLSARWTCRQRAHEGWRTAPDCSPADVTAEGMDSGAARLIGVKRSVGHDDATKSRVFMWLCPSSIAAARVLEPTAEPQPQSPERSLKLQSGIVVCLCICMDVVLI